MLFVKLALHVLFVVSHLGLTINVAQGAAPGELSKEMCKKYSQHIPNSHDCPFLKKSLDIGNEFAKQDEFPHMAILGFKKEDGMEWPCAGSLISEQYVLAAGHCLISRLYGTPTAVKVGVTDLTKTNYLQEIKVAEVIIHPEYKPPSAYNDIGLIKLADKVDINLHVRPACLYTETEIGVHQAINSGWGATEFGGEFNDVLQKAVLELYDKESCDKTYRKAHVKIANGITYDTMVCAGTKLILTNQPDTGGPLLIVHKEGGNFTCMYDIIGVASFGKPTVRSYIPSVYTRVSAFVKWIEDNVWK